ncbi:MAG: lipoprotein [Methylibium sp. NZG]|nr:MAG: lipoprotein [Methylibium sp. NZG]
MKRLLAAALAAFATAVLTACASAPVPSDYAAEKPALDLATYFNGDLVAHGIFTDRGGKVQRRFTVTMTGTWTGNDGVLDENFVYSDGKKERRVWRLKKLPDGRYTGTADDVVGTAQGQVAGNALQWKYTLRLPVGDKVYDVQFDDWMYLMDDRVMLNKAEMSKFGIRLGEVTLSFYKK